jgi:hypothetical protein
MKRGWAALICGETSAPAALPAERHAQRAEPHGRTEDA